MMINLIDNRFIPSEPFIYLKSNKDFIDAEKIAHPEHDIFMAEVLGYDYNKDVSVYVIRYQYDMREVIPVNL